METSSIHYRRNANMGIEIIFCDSSTISYPAHNHVSVLTIGIVLDGSIVLTANNKALTYEKNQTFFICPYVPHCILAHSRYTLLSLCIDKNAVTHYAAEKMQNNVIALLTSTLNTEEISQHQIVQLLHCLNTAIRSFSLISDANLCSIERNPWINDIKKQLELYPERDLSLDEMAKNAFVSKYHLIRSFQAEVGLTPHQFQLQNRIRKAQRLLHKTKTITEVALATGFCDQSHFIKQFEKQVGMTPRTYRLSSEIIGSA
ncbi:MAG: AraC family transcriptional regulator [Lachnospiraceae bacterium]|nr:AraC family transcriptional regulator [Lachnospiraceae bacterium]MDE7272774.1 AraC family transcriptional regulator [Lachnospiraceae bacterium]